MIASYRVGLRHDVTLEQHAYVLTRRRVNATVAHANRMVKRIKLAYIARYGNVFDARIIRELAVKYGVDQQLIPLVVKEVMA